MKIESDFRVTDGISYRRDHLGNWVSMLDSAQPNPSYVHNPGIHGWTQGENGLEKIDKVPTDPKPAPMNLDTSTVIKLGPHIIF